MAILARWRILRGNYIMSINQIVQGTFNNLLRREEELYKERIQICRNCKLLMETKLFGAICNPNIYLNPITNETSSTAKAGFKNGCGCVLSSKCRVKEVHCPLNK